MIRHNYTTGYIVASNLPRGSIAQRVFCETWPYMLASHGGVPGGGGDQHSHSVCGYRRAQLVLGAP